MAYVDGFVAPVPKANVETYRELPRLAGEVWKEHGALAYVECLADDVPHGVRNTRWTTRLSTASA